MALVRRKRSNEAATAIGDWEGMDGVGGGDDGSDRGEWMVFIHCGFTSCNIMRTPGLSSKRRRWRDGARSRPVDGGRLTSVVRRRVGRCTRRKRRGWAVARLHFLAVASPASDAAGFAWAEDRPFRMLRRDGQLDSDGRAGGGGG
ncbi:hypothetical protein DAI22_07g165201 [Oryza sativa Japonica Group]|nr:hypothetical protein DAI22_07g165201 [Oryza sativa Japonica Group]